MGSAVAITDALPPDQAARTAIERDLDRTLFVEAGAGSGKTTELVRRVVALIIDGRIELRSIAAITFTEKAGAELRDRIRRELEDRRTDPSTMDGVRARCRTALDQLDSAAIGTLHGFAQRLLTEQPIEAGLPPRIEVLDEVSSEVEFDRRWSAFRDRLFADEQLERTLLVLFASGAKPTALDALARAFEENWDLVEERVPDHADEPRPVHELLEESLAPIDAVCARRAGCRFPDDDKLALRLEEIGAYAARLRAITDELDLLEALDEDALPKPPSFKAGNIGKGANWDDIDTVRTQLRQAGEQLADVRESAGAACAHRLGAAIKQFTIAASRDRRTEGRLAFHDLLVLARVLLRHPELGPGVRARLHRRYERILLDEFQDTDPIQIELAVRIAATDPASEAAGAAPWGEVPVAAGQLFIVGDPMQSIYRFRRADISTFLAARERFAAGGSVVNLTTNFRSTTPVIEWVNHVFASLVAEQPDVDLPLPSQPDYVPIDAVRAAPPVGPPVAVLGRAEHRRDAEHDADALRVAEAAEVAATVVQALEEGWSVADGEGGWRPARLADITILIPARTSLPFLQDALDAYGVAHRAEASSLVYGTRAVRDLLMVLRAIDDPTNHLAIVSALRTPLLACGDDDLYRFKVERGGFWNYTGPLLETVPDDDPVRAGLAFLRSLHDVRQWQAPSELLDRIARDRRAFELGFAEGRPRDVWRRLRFVIDQARAWTEATGGSLREYLHWVSLQTSEGARVAEAILPETDDDAVRIMTIHAAKGLEFPITIVSGMSTIPQGRRAAAEVVFPAAGGVGYRMGRKVVTEEFELQAPIDEQMSYDERIRLLYVACTRARDHLVVSLHRKERAKAPELTKRTNAELLLDGTGELLDELPDAGLHERDELVPFGPPPPAPLPPFADWLAERDAALARGTRPTAIAATALTEEGAPDPGDELTAGLQKRPRDLDLPPWLKGRYGTAIGRAVHGTLQTIDLATGDGLDAAVAAQCEAEAIPDRAGHVRRRVRDALRSTVVGEAAGAPHWREVYACAPVEGRLLEGYIDLLYRGLLGLVVVDYKTAATNDPADLDRRLAGYRLQGASYALTVEATTGEQVDRVVFLFLTPEGPIERELPDLHAAMDDVRRLVAAARELTVDELEAVG